jgi:hypothetical protein
MTHVGKAHHFANTLHYTHAHHFANALHYCRASTLDPRRDSHGARSSETPMRPVGVGQPVLPAVSGSTEVAK